MVGNGEEWENSGHITRDMVVTSDYLAPHSAGRVVRHPQCSTWCVGGGGGAVSAVYLLHTNMWLVLKCVFFGGWGVLKVEADIEPMKGSRPHDMGVSVLWSHYPLLHTFWSLHARGLRIISRFQDPPCIPV